MTPPETHRPPSSVLPAVRLLTLAVVLMCGGAVAMLIGSYMFNGEAAALRHRDPLALPILLAGLSAMGGGVAALVGAVFKVRRLWLARKRGP
jgi:hypothetical protein